MIDAMNAIGEAYPWFWPGMIFIYGICIGSFFNVVIYRIPAGKSVVYPGSTCGCGERIKGYDNIPILSWCLLRGKARCCGKPFSVRYPLVELLTGVLFVGIFLTHSVAASLALWVFVGMMLSAAFIDLDTMEIPDRFSVGGCIVGVIASVLVPSLHIEPTGMALFDGMRGCFSGITGALVGSGLILWVALIAELVLRKEAMGFGDVKLMGAIGAFCGWKGAIFALFGGACLGCIGIGVGYILIYLFGKKETVSMGTKSEDGGLHIPFGPSLVAGALVYLIFAQEWVDAYFNSVIDVLY